MAPPQAVLKFGGDVVADAPALAAVLADVAALVRSGWRVLICHGGGPQASALQRRLNLTPHKVGGRRVTDEATLQVVKQVLAGEVSVDVVAAGLAAGLAPVGVAGVSAALVTAHRRPPMVVREGGPDPVDFGLVGAIDEIRTELVTHLWAGGYTPVVNPLAVDPRAGTLACPVYNINADTVACALASALRVDHLFLMTGVPGVLRDASDPSTRIPRLTVDEAREAMDAGIISGGMIPKIEEAMGTLRRGVGSVHILGATAGALAAEAEAPGSVGTVLVGEGAS